MYALRSRKIIFILFIGLASLIKSYAQPNLEQYDLKKLHFGFTIATNLGRLQVSPNTAFTAKDTLMNIGVVNFPGIGLGAITNLNIGKYWDLRLMAPVISFVQRNLNYTFPTGTKEVKVESAYCDASLLVKYKSARRKNSRFYVVGGPRFSYDFSSTVSRNRGIEKPVVSLNPITYGYEFGFGFDFYFEYFKFSPEIKNCQTWGSAMYKDGLIYTNAIQSISPQMIQISLHFE